MTDNQPVDLDGTGGEPSGKTGCVGLVGLIALLLWVAANCGTMDSSNRSGSGDSRADNFSIVSGPFLNCLVDRGYDTVESGDLSQLRRNQEAIYWCAEEPIEYGGPRRQRSPSETLPGSSGSRGIDVPDAGGAGAPTTSRAAPTTASTSTITTTTTSNPTTSTTSITSPPVATTSVSRPNLGLQASVACPGGELVVSLEITNHSNTDVLVQQIGVGWQEIGHALMFAPLGWPVGEDPVVIQPGESLQLVFDVRGVQHPSEIPVELGEAVEVHVDFAWAGSGDVGSGFGDFFPCGSG